MRWGIGIVAFFIVVTLGGCHAMKMAKLHSISQFYQRTSSTLLWEAAEEGAPFPPNSVPVDTRDPAVVWCRASQNSVMIPGSARENLGCKLAFLKSKVTIVRRFEVLVSLNGSARIGLHEWDSFSAKPMNAISSPDRILAVVPVDDGATSGFSASHIGTKATDRKVITQRGGALWREDKAFILTEDEPVKYELNDVSFITTYENESRRTTVLVSSTMENDEDEEVEVSLRIPYVLEQKQYWGRAKGTILGTDAQVTPPTCESPVGIKWGIESTRKRTSFCNITYDLPPKSVVTYYVIGTVTKYEVKYKGDLEALYGDGFRASRPIESLHVSESVTMVIVKYGVPFHRNGTTFPYEERSQLVYRATTTTTAATTATTTTTTSTTTTTTTPAPTTTTKMKDADADDPSSEWEREAVLIEGRPRSSSPTSSDDRKPDRITLPTWRLTGETAEKTAAQTTTAAATVGRSSLSSRSKLATTTESNGGTTSGKFISGVGTMITAFVFWYYGGGGQT